MIAMKLICVFLALLLSGPPITVLSQETDSIIQYNVISLLNQSESMAVKIDNVTYAMQLRDSATSQILYSSMGPTAKSGYNYLRIKENNVVLEEPFHRQPVSENTPNEFFNRTWNNYSIAQFPQIYPPLPAIHRLQSGLHIEGQIPTIHIVGSQTLFDRMHTNSTEDLSVVANFSYVSLNDAQFYQDAEFSLAGRSSRWLPKLSYNVELDNDNQLLNNSQFKLRALDTDPSYIREQLCYDIVQAVGLASAEFSYVRVFLNNYELGLYGIIEKFADPWLANTFANGSTHYKHGYLYQGVFETPASAAKGHISDLSYLDDKDAYGEGQYKIKQPVSKGDSVNWKPLQEFTKFINQTSPTQSDAVATWKLKLNTDSFLRSMALEVLLGFADGYASMADNYYLYHNITDKSFFYIPSDLDLSLGSTMFKLQQMWSGNYSEYPGLMSRPLMQKMMQVPEFKDQFNGLLTNFTTLLINPNKTDTRIDNLVKMIEQDVAWDKSLPRVGGNLFNTVDPNNNNISESGNVISDVIGNALPKDMDPDTAANMAKRINASIPFMEAINGPTGYVSLAGVKEWINNINQNIAKFYS